jgi:hypothetical protein
MPASLARRLPFPEKVEYGVPVRYYFVWPVTPQNDAYRLTLLTLAEDIEDIEDEEDLEESWTPRFKR